MGKSRFKFSLMIPTSWFHKIKDSEKATTNSPTNKTPAMKTASSSSHLKARATQSNPRCQPGRASYYFPSHQNKLPNSSVLLESSTSTFSSTKSKKKTKKKRETLLTVAECSGPEISSSAVRRSDDYEGIHCAVKPVISENKEPARSDIYGSKKLEYISRSSRCRFTSLATDIILDVRWNNSPSRDRQETEDIIKVQELVLPPIVTKPAKSSLTRENKYPEPGSTPLQRERRKSLKLQGRRAFAFSPRIFEKNIPRKRLLTESFAVVKNSSDPARDFRESMMEMIVVNDIRASKDLEDLLACYLSLNSSEYHEIIVKVFKQIWFDLTKLRLRDSS